MTQYLKLVGQLLTKQQELRRLLKRLSQTIRQHLRPVVLLLEVQRQRLRLIQRLKRRSILLTIRILQRQPIMLRLQLSIL